MIQKSKIGLSIIFLLFWFSSAGVIAQISAFDATKAMGRGVNMGNTFDPPDGEGAWGNPTVVESNFDDYKNAGFTCVRIPITWDKHTATTSPYTINATWLNRIEQIVDWGLSRNLMIIINAHHDAWIKENYTVANKSRFDSIWSQVATRFKDKSDKLSFEVINEPNPLSLANVNDMNARIIKIIRKTNPTRNILFSGNMWSNAAELIATTIPNDSHLIGYYHSYDPYPFGLEGPGTYGSDNDINATKARFDQVTAWSVQHNLPVVLSEFGATKKCEYNSRMCYYASITEQALVQDVAFMVWEDGGDFKFYNRVEHSWNEIKDILIHTFKESPNKMKISTYADTLVKIEWNNRTSFNDSIIVERKTESGNFTFCAKISPLSASFIDTSSHPGKTYYYRLKANLKDSIEIQSYPIMITVSSIYRKPFSGTAIPIPGIVEAENYDKGGEGLTYHDFDASNNGGKYRLTEGVDIGEFATGKYSVGYVVSGEWLEYSIHVDKAGTYDVLVSVSALADGGQFNLQFKNSTSVSFTAKNTANRTVFTNISNKVTLEAGDQIMRLNITKTPEFDIDMLTFSLSTPVNEISRNEISVYPNPATDHITLSGIDSPGIVTIYSVTGALIKSVPLNGNITTQTISIESLEAGVYFVNFQNNNETIVKKILKSDNSN